MAIMETGDAGSSQGDGSSSRSMVATLGMFIIDTFRFEDEETGKDLGDGGLGDQIGGGGTYFALGARMWLPPQQVLMTIDRGHDFPDWVQRSLDRYAQPSARGQHSLWRFRQRRDGTTRAVNIYKGQERGFAYLTPKIRLDPTDLLDETFTHLPNFIHCICSPERALQICNQIDSLSKHWTNGKRPCIVWEPIPDSAVLDNLQQAIDVSARVDVLSPNHDEAASFLEIQLPKRDPDPSKRRSAIEGVARRLHQKIDQRHRDKAPVICIRSGTLGAFTCMPQGLSRWTEAYHLPSEAARVVDVTGAGNAWLGGFTAGLARFGKRKSEWSLDEVVGAAQMGAVSASFTIEQQGLPSIEVNADGGSTRWNGEYARDRLERMRDRDTDVAEVQ